MGTFETPDDNHSPDEWERFDPSAHIPPAETGDELANPDLLPTNHASEYATMPAAPEQPPAVAALNSAFAYYEDRYEHGLERYVQIHQERIVTEERTLLFRPGLKNDDEIATTVTNKLRDELHRQNTESLQYAGALKNAGLQENGALIIPAPMLRDSGKLAAVLTEAVTPDDQLRTGVERAITNTLATVRDAYIPVIEFDEERARIHLHTGIQTEVVLPEKMTDFQRLLDGALGNAHLLTEPLEALDVQPHLRRTLLAAGVAHHENVLGDLMVALEWGMLQPATTNPDNTEWTSWTDAGWQRFDTYMQNLAAKAPGGSRTVQTIARTVRDNIFKFRNGELSDPLPRHPLPKALRHSPEVYLEAYHIPITDTDEERLNEQYNRTLAAMNETARLLGQFL